MNELRSVSTDQAPRPGGHYSQAVVAGNLIFVSGQLPITTNGTIASNSTFGEQVRLALSNVLAIIQAAGSDRNALVRVTAYIVGISNWAEFNRVYGEVVGPSKPARTVVPVPELHHGCLVEIDAIAMRELPTPR